ncbi:MAG: tripartite tricarboxylate transporter TctB family protein [Lachnospiraceae bacterium]|nr:tripartite tricarboxylate transporter TctB family protein [Lachnospiraceae bacterium]
MKKLKADTIAGLICMAFGVFFLIMTALNPQMAFVATTSDGVPGGGFFPYILSVAIILMGGGLTVRGIKTEAEQYVDMTPENKKNMKVLLLMVAGLVVFLIAWKLTAPHFGNNAFMACVFLFEIYLNKLFERSWKFALIYAVIFTAFIYLVFNMGFSILFNA